MPAFGFGRARLRPSWIGDRLARRLALPKWGCDMADGSRTDPAQHLNSGRLGGVGQHEIKATAVEVPAGSIGIEDEVVFVQVGAAPRGRDPW